MAFLPVQILIVTFIIEKILDSRGKKERRRKINVVINVFFSEVGTECILTMSEFADNLKDLKQYLLIKEHWGAAHFGKARKQLKIFDYSISSTPAKLEALKVLLFQNRQFMLSLFANQNLLEHDEFTDMLWAVFHIHDELQNREDLSNLPDADLEHILLDIKRAYPLLLVEWITYMQNIKINYPYLYRFSIINNPFE